MSDISNQIEQVFTRIKKDGFPYPESTYEARNKDFQTLINFKRDTIIDRKNKIVGQSPHGLSLLGLIWNMHGLSSVVK